MGRDIELRNVGQVFDELAYPVDRTDAADQFADVTLRLADGEANLGALLAETDSDRFETRTDIETELHNVLPRNAVGEPYQSEGDA